MSKGYSIRVKIGGRSFGLISDSKPEYLKNIAMQVDKSISDLLIKNPNLTLEKASILTALKYCDDANKKVELSGENNNLSDEDNNLRKQVIEYSKELRDLTMENKELKSKLKKLREKLN